MKQYTRWCGTWFPAAGRRLAAGGMILVLGSNSAFADTLGQAGDDGVSLLRVGFALALCLALAIAGALILKARTGNGLTLSWPALARPSSQRLRVVETLGLRNHVDLSIVSCDGCELLIATSEKGAQILTPINLVSASMSSRNLSQ